MCYGDTIVAQSTPSGYGGIGILRVSGSKSKEVAKLLLGKLPKARYAEYLRFLDVDHKTIDEGIALWFPSPNSFTGEDVLELQGHGGPVILDILLKRILSIDGLRIAHPGEFSQRAFLNEKLDLVQAEAIADLIDASSEYAARSAMNSLQGVFSNQINNLIEKIISLRMHIEATLDFPDEQEINLLSNKKITVGFTQIIHDLKRIQAVAVEGSIIREGLKVVIAGPPNAGKSSLINVLTGRETAIVTGIAGTTRDVLRDQIYINGILIHIIDTAGLREAKDEVEHIGIRRAWNEIVQADHILFMVDSSTINTKELSTMLLEFIARLPNQKVPITIIRNKIDIIGNHNQKIIKVIHGYPVIYLSTYTNDGIEILRQHLKNNVVFSGHIEGTCLARRRHLESLKLAASYLKDTKQHILLGDSSLELLAEDLRLAQLSLSKITGKFSSDDLLERIFSNFCIGK